MADLATLERTDPTAVVEGRWFPYKADIRLKIARLFNPRYTKRSRELGQGEYLARIRAGGDMQAEAAEAMLTQLLAETVLVDWEHLEIDKAPLAYSPTNALRVLTEFPDVRRFVFDTASNLEPFRLPADQGGAGNSEPPSAGNGGGRDATKHGSGSMPS